MKLATSTGDFERFCSEKNDQLRHVAEAGFRYVDLSLYEEAKANSETMADDWRKKVDSWQKTADKLGVKFVQAHSPGGNPLLNNENYDILFESTVRSIEICGILGIPNTVVHSGWGETISKDEFFERNIAFYRRLYPTMEKNNVSVLIENSTKKNMGDMYYFLTGAEMAEFLDVDKHPLMGACWDTGHANCEGHQYDDIISLGSYLKAIHFNDNSGRGDEHIIPFCGTMSVDEVIQGLIDSGYKGYCTFEANNTLRPYKYWQGDRHPFRNERLRDVSLHIQKAFERSMYEIGKYVLETYDIFEE